MRAKLSFLVVFVLLLTGNNSLNWMAYGNFTPDNMTIIWDRIHNIDRNIQPTALAAFASSFSDYLTGLWDSAWNVVIYYYTDGNNYDAVVNGYGFRSHWFWVNGFQLNIGYASIAIWKDYNCAGWKTYDSSGSNQKYSSYTNTVSSYMLVGGDLNNIWKLGNDFVKHILRYNAGLLQDSYAYTAIPTQTSNSRVYFKACVKDYIVLTSITDSRPYGAIAIMQMR